MNYSINIHQKKVIWTSQCLKNKLSKLGNLSGKKVAWVQADLTLKKSNFLSRLFWTLIAKHFAWMRKHFYGVDLKLSVSVLRQLSPLVTANQDTVELYNHAVSNIQTIAPKHAKSLTHATLAEKKDTQEDECPQPNNTLSSCDYSSRSNSLDSRFYPRLDLLINRYTPSISGRDSFSTSDDRTLGFNGLEVPGDLSF